MTAFPPNSTGLNALVIGFGKMGMLHAATLRVLPQIHSVAICERSPLIIEGIQKFCRNIETFASLDQAFKEKTFNLAIIATPNATHLDLIKTTLQHQCHLFVEKPILSSLEEAHQLNAFGIPANQRIMVGHCLRFVPTFRLAKRILNEQVLGQIRSFRATMYSPDVLTAAKGWRFSKESKGTGVLLDLGSHVVDMVRFLLGQPHRLHGQTRSIVSSHVEDAFEASFEYENFSGIIESSWSHRHVRKATLEIQIDGTNGNLRVLDDLLQINLLHPHSDFPSGLTRFPITQLEEAVPFDLAGPSYTRQMQHWIQSIQTQTLNENNWNENFVNLQLLEAIRSSNGQWIHISKNESPIHAAA